MKSTINNDRRIRKTTKALRGALAELMLSKNIGDITIKELTDKADIHRSTFYAHFYDIYDLYSQMEDEVIEEIKNIITSNFSLCFNDYYNVLLSYAEENQQMCKLLFRNYDSSSSTHPLTTLFREACLKHWSESIGTQKSTEELDYLVEYHLQGCFALICRWTNSNFKYPKETLIKMISDIETMMELHISKGKQKY